MVTIWDFYRIDWDWFIWRTHYCFCILYCFLIGFLFIRSRSIRVVGAYELPASASIKAWHFMPSVSIITKGYVTLLPFVVNRTFDVFSQTYVWCFSLQLAHVLLLWQSKGWCLGPVQLKDNIFFKKISLCSGFYSLSRIH